MPQPKKGARLGSGPAHQRQMLSNLASSLFEHERIKTTEAKAKMLRPFAERLITKAKDGSIHKRRQVLAVIEDRKLVHKLFDDIGPRFADRNGGYTRILKLGPRNGDAAPMVLIELVEEGTVARVTDSDEEGGKKRRLSRPTRRRSTPQDKPVQSKAAEAAAAGTPGDEAGVEPPDEVVEETAETAAPVEGSEPESDVPEGDIPEDKSDSE